MKAATCIKVKSGEKILVMRMVISVKAKVIFYHLGEEEGKGGRGGGIKDFGVTLKHTKIFEIFLRSPPQ